MSQKIKVLIPIDKVPENSIIYKSTKGKISYTVKHLSTNGRYVNVLVNNINPKAIYPILEDSTEVIWETDLETLNEIYNEKTN